MIMVLTEGMWEANLSTSWLTAITAAMLVSLTTPLTSQFSLQIMDSLEIGQTHLMPMRSYLWSSMHIRMAIMLRVLSQ